MKDINDSQVRHEMLIDFLSQFSQYQYDGQPRLPKVKKQRTSDKVKNIPTEDIGNAVVVFVDTLNIGGGSVADINLYKLLNAYLTIPEYRGKINEIVNEAHSYNYKKNKK